jgi:hypothetical protein
MCKGHRHVGLVGGPPAKLPGWPTPLCSLPRVSLAVTLSKRWWKGTRGLESVEAMFDEQPAKWLGRPANTWWITNLIKSVTAPRDAREDEQCDLCAIQPMTEEGWCDVELVGSREKQTSHIHLGLLLHEIQMLANHGTPKVGENICKPSRNHYIGNSNRRHRSETCAKAIISDLEKWDVPISARIKTGFVEGKKRRSTFQRISIKLISEMCPLLCKSETYVRSAFFDISVHFTTHLIKEIKLLGPVFLQQMYEYERFNGILKSFVRNRA